MTKDMWDMAKICVKWLNYLRNGLKMWEMTQRLGKSLKCLGMALIDGANLKYLRNGIRMFQMT